MADVLERRTLKAGESIFREGEEGHNAYVIQAGEVQIMKTIEDTPKVLATLGPGAIFGEMALIDSKPRMASAQAVGDGCTIITVTRNMFEAKLAKSDPFIRGLLNILAETIRRG